MTYAVNLNRSKGSLSLVLTGEAATVNRLHNQILKLLQAKPTRRKKSKPKVVRVSKCAAQRVAVQHPGDDPILVGAKGVSGREPGPRPSWRGTPPRVTPGQKVRGRGRIAAADRDYLASLADEPSVDIDGWIRLDGGEYVCPLCVRDRVESPYIATHPTCIGAHFKAHVDREHMPAPLLRLISSLPVYEG